MSTFFQICFQTFDGILALCTILEQVPDSLSFLTWKIR